VSIKEFLPTLIHGPWRALISKGPSSFAASARSEAPVSEAGRRIWLFHLGIAWLAGLPLFILLAVAAHFSGYAGIWSFLWSPARSAEPPMWVFLLGDARVGALFFCAIIGFLPALLTRRSGWAWILAGVGLFPGIFSIAGAWILVVAERLAIWIREAIAEKNPALRRDIFWRGLIALSFVVFTLVCGAALRDWVQYAIHQAPYDPEWRLLRFLIGLSILTALETVASLAFFHFYFIIITRRR